MGSDSLNQEKVKESHEDIVKLFKYTKLSEHSRGPPLYHIKT